jgi:hypothetical protein
MRSRVTGSRLSCQGEVGTNFAMPFLTVVSISLLFHSAPWNICHHLMPDNHLLIQSDERRLVYKAINAEML